MRLQALFQLTGNDLGPKLRAGLIAYEAPNNWSDFGSEIDSGFAFFGDGNYVWVGEAPDDFDGLVRFFNSETGQIYGLGFASKYEYVGPVQVDMEQPYPLSVTVGTLGESYAAARAQGIGWWRLDKEAKTITLLCHDNETPFCVLDLDKYPGTLARGM